MALAERDRHRSDLDEATQQFITVSTKELIEELYESIPDFGANDSRDSVNKNGHIKMSPDSNALHRSHTIACVAARDDADEIVGTMLAQLLEQTGQSCQSLAVETVAEIISILEDTNPNVICISALPPLAFAHALNFYLRLRARFPRAKFLIGLWGYSGDISRIARRMRLAEGDALFTSLRQVLEEINRQVPIETSPVPNTISSDKA